MRLRCDVGLIPPQYVKRQKSDAADAGAIGEAVSRPDMRFVPLKTVDQRAVLTLHRARSLLVRQRTRLANAIRRLPGAFGIVIPEGSRRLTELRGRAAGTATDCLAEEARSAVTLRLRQTLDMQDRIGAVEAGILGRLQGGGRRHDPVRVRSLKALALGVVRKGEPRRLVDDQFAGELPRLLGFGHRQSLQQQCPVADRLTEAHAPRRR
jgi:transposase